MLSSSFQPVRLLQSRRIVGMEGLAQSDVLDTGLSVWRLLNNAASDDESIELDRLCRLVHSLNFFRQAPAAEWSLFLNVHERLLAAVEGDHGRRFRQVLQTLQLPHERVVLQLPATSTHQRWALAQVAESYRRHGFRFSVQARTLADAMEIVDKVQPQFLRINACDVTHEPAALDLLHRAQALNTQVIFQQLQGSDEYLFLQRLASAVPWPLQAQGYFLDTPSPDLPATGKTLLGRPEIIRFYPSRPVREEKHALRG